MFRFLMVSVFEQMYIERLEHEHDNLSKILVIFLVSNIGAGFTELSFGPSNWSAIMTSILADICV